MILTPLQKYKKELRKACEEAKLGDWFERYYNHARGLGNTDMLIHACKQKGGTLICGTEQQAVGIHEIRGIKTVSIYNGNFSVTPTRSCVDNYAIRMFIQENRRLVVLAEQLITIMQQKGID